MYGQTYYCNVYCRNDSLNCFQFKAQSVEIKKKTDFTGEANICNPNCVI